MPSLHTESNSRIVINDANHSNLKWDAIVIGSGIGGLTTAAYLTANGLRTLVLEQWLVAGGSSHVFRRKPNWEFDVGMHYVGDCGSNGQIPRILRGLGLDDRIEFLEMDKSGFDTIVFPDQKIKVPVGWNNYLDNMLEAFPTETKGIKQFINIISTLGHSLDHSKSLATNNGLIKAIKNAGLSSIWGALPVSSLLSYCRLSPRARAALSVQFGLYGCPPARAPVAMHAGLMHNFIHGGAWYPKGGGQTFAGNLIDVITSHGGAVKTGVAVKKIIIENNKTTGVQLTSGEIINSHIVISNADIKKTYLDLIGIENLPKGLVKKSLNYKMAAPFINVYMGINVNLKDKIPCTNFFSLQNTNDLEGLHSKLIDHSTKIDRRSWLNLAQNNITAFIHCASVKDPSNTRHAPDGCSTLEVMAQVPYDRRLWTTTQYGEKYWKDSQYQETKEFFAELMAERAEAIIPEIKSHIVFKEVATPLTQERFVQSTEGTAYGLESNIMQTGPFRPRSSTKIKGLFIAGSSTAWGPSLEGAFISGIYAASAILNRNIDEELRQGHVYVDKGRLRDLNKEWDSLKESTHIGKSVIF